MLNMEWTREHAVGVAGVDDEHKTLFRLCGDLRRAVESGAQLAALQSIVNDLAIHAAMHFTHEEREMRAAGYSLYAWHRRQHQAARAKVATLTRRVQRGDREAARELSETTSKWMHDHIRLADRMFGAYLRNYERMRAARAS